MSIDQVSSCVTRLSNEASCDVERCPVCNCDYGGDKEQHVLQGGMRMAKKRVKPLEIERRFVKMTPEQKDKLTDAMAELIVGYLEKHGPDFPRKPESDTSITKRQ